MYTQISMEHHNKRRNQLINRIFPLYAVEPGRRKLRIRKRIYMRKLARKTLDQERLQGVHSRFLAVNLRTVCSVIKQNKRQHSIEFFIYLFYNKRFTIMYPFPDF